MSSAELKFNRFYAINTVPFIIIITLAATIIAIFTFLIIPTILTAHSISLSIVT